MPAYSSLRELILTRLREFYRQPARIFWVYGFPLMLAVVLGMGFASKKPDAIEITVVQAPGSDRVVEAIEKYAQENRPGLSPIRFQRLTKTQALKAVREGETPLVVEPSGTAEVEFHYDPTRQEANAAYASVNDALQRAAGRSDPVPVSNQEITEPGSRYIDFLIPGLIGLNSLGGGLWGIGFLLVNMRIGKLLKRFAATPMPRRNFLLSLLGARLVFLIPDVAVLMALGMLVFKMPMRGSVVLLALTVVLGAFAFAGIGMLIASRAKSTEAVSGLMNMVMIPMWLFSGVFFRWQVFPKPMWNFIQALPLTQMVEALRGVILHGHSLVQIGGSLLILAAWGLVTFFLALRFFRWT